MTSEVSSNVKRAVNLVVKTTDGSCDDLQLTCALDTTVVQVMELIRNQHPYKPEVTQQRLIYLGRLWVNSMTLRASLREPDVDKSQFVHLLIKDSHTSRGSAQATSKPTPAAPIRAVTPQSNTSNAVRLPGGSCQLSDQRVSDRSVAPSSSSDGMASIERTTSEIEKENEVLKERLRQMEARMNSDPVSSANMSNEETMRLWRVYYSYVLQHYHSQTQLNLQPYTPVQPSAHPQTHTPTPSLTPSHPTHIPMSWPEYYHQQVHSAAATAQASGAASTTHTPSPPHHEQLDNNTQQPEAAAVLDEYDDGEVDVNAQQVAAQNYNRTFVGQVGIFLKLCLLMYVFGREATVKKQIMLAISAAIVFLYQTGRLNFIITAFQPPQPTTPATTPAHTPPSNSHTEGGPPGDSSSSSTDSSSSSADDSKKEKASTDGATSSQHTLSRQGSATDPSSELSTTGASSTPSNTNNNNNTDTNTNTSNTTQTEGPVAVERPSLLHEVETFLFNFVSSLLPSAQVDGNAVPPEVEDNGPAGNIFG